MGDSLMTIIAIFLAVVLMFLFPMLSTTGIADNISQLSAETAVTDFVDDSRAIGKVTVANYEKLVNTLNATGNSFTIEMERKVLDENVGKKTAWTNSEVIGENVYYSIYTSQILEDLLKGDDHVMKEGDHFSCTVKNDNKTLSETFRSIFYSSPANDSYQIGASHSGIVTATGS